MSSGSESSGSRGSPSNMTANIPELFAVLTTQQKPDIPGNGTEAGAPQHCSNDDVLATAETMNDMGKAQSSDGIKLFDTEEREASVAIVAENESNIIAEDAVIVNEESERKVPTEPDVVDIVRQLQGVQQEKGLSEEADLIGALTLSQAQLMNNVYGTLTAFIDRHPGLRVVGEDVYYNTDPENEDASQCTSLLQDGATILSACYDDDDRQHSEAYDDGPQLTRVSSSSSSNYESAGDEADVQQEERRMKDGWSQASSPPICLSRALQAVPKTCDAETQTQGWDPALFSELKSMLQKRDAEVAVLKGRLETLRESHALEVHELQEKIDKLLQTPEPEPTGSKAEVKNCAAEKDEPTGTKGQDTQVNSQPLQPWPQPCERDPQPLPRPEQKQHSLPVDPTSAPLPPSDEELRRHAASPPVPDFSELPGGKEGVAAPCSHVESIPSSQEESSRKSKMEKQILKIVRMVQKKRPDCTDEEIRELVDHMRRSQGGFSRMTFHDIVAMLLGNLKAAPQEEP